jgi:small subunit ribosomal protein S18
MARNNQRGGTTTRRAPKDLGRRVKKKPCALCRDKTEWVDYKDIPMLRKYMSDRGKIRSRRVTGNCAQHQRALAQAIKTARELVLLPYTQRTVTERPGGRGRDRGERSERTLSDTMSSEERRRPSEVEVIAPEAVNESPPEAPTESSSETDGAVSEEVSEVAAAEPEDGAVTGADSTDVEDGGE